MARRAYCWLLIKSVYFVNLKTESILLTLLSVRNSYFPASTVEEFAPFSSIFTHVVSCK